MKTTALIAGAAFALLSACGGGGGSGGSGGSQPSMSVSPHQLSVTGTTTGAAPSGTIKVTVLNAPSSGLYAGYANTSNGIANVSLGGGTNTTQDLLIAFKDPSTLAPGVYSDTLDIAVCLDQQCATQITNSPQSVAVQYTVTQGSPETATPTLSSLNPNTAAAGGPDFTLGVTGVNFSSGAVVLWNGLPRPTTYVSATQLSAQISASDISYQTYAQVTVSNQATGGGISAPLSFSIALPAPVLSSISPSSVYAGAAPFTLTANGTGFVQGSTIVVGGTSLYTTYVSNTQLSGQVPTNLITNIGVLSVQVNTYGLNPSNTLSLAVGQAPLALTTISPATVTVGGRSYVQTIIGSGFTSDSVVQWNGSARPTTFVSGFELLAQINAADIATIGSASINVLNTGANAGTTSSATVAISAPSIDAVAFQINPGHSGTVQFSTVVSPGSLPSAPAWTVDLGGPPSYALIARGKVFVTVDLGGGAAALYALDQTNGSVLWGPTLISGYANAAYDAGKVFVVGGTYSSSPGIQAFDADSGAILWTAIGAQSWLPSPPVAMHGMVYFSVNGTTFAFDQGSGAQAWWVPSASGTAGMPTVTVDGIYSSGPCTTVDLRPWTGERVWMNNTGCSGGGGATGVAANGEYFSPDGFGTYSGEILDAETGVYGGAYIADVPPAIGSQTGYFLQSGTLRAVSNANNTILWSFSGDNSLVTSPIAVNGYAIVGGSSGNLYILDAANGALLRTITMGAAIPSGAGWGSGVPISGLSAGDGLLVVPAGNKVSAFVLSTSP